MINAILALVAQYTLFAKSNEALMDQLFSAENPNQEMMTLNYCMEDLAWKAIEALEADGYECQLFSTKYTSFPVCFSSDVTDAEIFDAAENVDLFRFIN